MTFSYGIQDVYRTLDVMNLREFAEYQNSVIAELGTGYTPTEEFADPSLLGEGTRLAGCNLPPGIYNGSSAGHIRRQG